MKGKTIYFTAQEMRALLLTLEDWQENMLPEHETVYAHRLKYGLGAAWGKISEKTGITNAHKIENHAR